MEGLVSTVMQASPVTRWTAGSVAALGAFIMYKRKQMSKKYYSEDEIDLDTNKVSIASHVMENYLPYNVKWALARAFWAPTVTYNVALSYVLPVVWFNRIDENMVLGALPFATTAKELYAKENVRAVINLCEEYEGPVEEYKRLGIAHLRLPVVDYCSPSLEQMEKALDFMQPFMQKGESIYVHCKAGKGRSTTVVLGYLMKYRHMSRKKAQKHVIIRRPQVSRYIFRRQVLQDLERKYDLPRDE